MAEEIKLPEISENVESGEVIQVLVKTGDFIEADQPVVELETEKAAFEVPSPVGGKVVEVAVKEGDEVKVGQTIAKVDTEAEEGEEKEAEEQPAEEKAEKEEKKEEAKREPPEKEEPEKPKQKPAEKKEKAKKPEKPKTAEPAKPERAEKKRKPSETVPAAPSVRQLARELGIDINDVSGSGPAGRISADDVKKHAKRLITGAGVSVPAKAKETRTLPDFTKWGEVERKPMSATRRKIAETLSYTWSNVPQVTQYDQADVTMLEEFRRQYSQKIEEAGGKLTVTSILLKVVALALKEFPIVNASLDLERQEIIYKQFINVAVAVDTDRGLLVPVIRDADKKSLLELSVELAELAQKTREHKVGPDDMVGGNFTITNLGGIGGTNFAPIIYWPQVAILGVARANKQPLYIDSRFEPRLVLPLSLSYDHRVIDGAEGLRFLRWIGEMLEKPFLLAMREGG